MTSLDEFEKIVRRTPNGIVVYKAEMILDYSEVRSLGTGTVVVPKPVKEPAIAKPIANPAPDFTYSFATLDDVEEEDEELDDEEDYEEEYEDPQYDRDDENSQVDKMESEPEDQEDDLEDEVQPELQPFADPVIRPYPFQAPVKGLETPGAIAHRVSTLTIRRPGASTSGEHNYSGIFVHEQDQTPPDPVARNFPLNYHNGEKEKVVHFQSTNPFD